MDTAGTPSDPSPAPPAVILVQPREDGNIGSVCRAMANMGLSELRLVDPVAKLGRMARAMAVGAREILDGAGIYGSLAEALAPFRRVVGTTSARDRQLSVPVLTPRELPARLAADPPGTPSALVFGSEVGGLTNDEMALCHWIVTIPCALEHPTLNLAQAVLVVAYELFVTTGAGRRGPLVEGDVALPAETAVVDGLFAHLEDVATAIGFARDRTFPGVMRDLRQLAGRAGLTEREALLLRGMLRRTQNALERATGVKPASPPGGRW